ncbi:hypothetical protein BATDEDRAFT_92666 [Batrachochytrium dendrobatidis JAM81]|uniref:Large ribosomal subunit protein uL24 C-terminal domain-containing protein n=1 Tax=Batrachochytrium dendrobatidis (strain JAM81 / FGSC 10211) TaxID=684364 RepID=F4PE48_BATDJ|nr:uncharacterized protein BATDEDRAFT_92666 [Batrachochytrium dendrobatidis JAM81]EGF76493.1 hypothetical protein BATDEDRAFT_92666 [Batrachochytrium dendrobatidis JAM81]|eukprot:XP_006682887.1 hypothetical protein BATDEDRAFT_92666 [Batrachochytrium dendrobatidis JAM81]
MPPKFRGANFLKPKQPNIHPRNQLKEWHLFKGDMVQIVGGEKDVGKQGKVLEVIKQLNSVIVEDCKLGVKHVKPNPFYPKGGRIHKEMPIHYTQVQLVDPTISRPTETKLFWEYDHLKHRKVQRRLSLATDTVIPVPEPENPFKKLEEGALDTKPAIVSQVTWTPDITQCPFPPPFMNELERMRRKNREAQAL